MVYLWGVIKMVENTKHLFNQSCLSTMASLDDNHADLVITSPPYNMNLRIRNGKYCSRQVTRDEFSTKYNGFDDNLPIEEFYHQHKTILKELLRVSPLIFYNIGIVTGSKRAFFKLIGDFNEQLKEIIFWDKGHGQPAMHIGVLNRRTEMILIFDKYNAISREFKNAQFERGTLEDLWLIKKKKSKSKNHNASFPEELVTKIIENFSKKGDTIYDPFAGTGTTLRVADKLGRNSIGSEIIKEYFEFAKGE